MNFDGGLWRRNSELRFVLQTGTTVELSLEFSFAISKLVTIPKTTIIT